MLSLSCVCVAEKPGSCPKPVGAGVCVEKCSGDSNCPNNQKCCSNGCGHQCMAP
uniref:WAP domain-containing protein n=1 Tax=Cyprinus carpio TaxID=7962 RepID=A0A8C1XHM9_CYPCA